MHHPVSSRPSQSPVETVLRDLLAETLGMAKKRVAEFDADTGLFGALPEFDSMAVAHFLTALEEKLGAIIDDDDVGAEDFETFGTLLAFAERLAAR